MESEFKNPWEDISCEFSADTFNEPPDVFNSIKLNDFPFLKSNFSFVDYLVRCNLCKIILLPETVHSHYENRHLNSSRHHDSSCLPYQAFSHYDAPDVSSKRDRGSSSKRQRGSFKRAKRGSLTADRETTPVGTVSETDSLSSFTDDTLKRFSRNPSDDESEKLREPVLLKLAKSECSTNFDGCKLAPPKTEEESNFTPSDRSLWSLVYRKKHATSETDCELSPSVQPSLLEQAANGDPSVTEPRPSVLANAVTPDLTSSTISSCPPTHLPLHLPSPASSNVSDDVVFLGSTTQLLADQSVRSISRSSVQSSSSSGFETPVDCGSRSTPAANSCNSLKNRILHRRAGDNESEHMLSSGSRVVPPFSQANFTGSASISGCPTALDNEEKVVEIDPHADPMGHIRTGKKVATCFSGESNLEVEIQKPGSANVCSQNGYHSWLNNARNLQANFVNKLVAGNPDVLARQTCTTSHILSRRRVGPGDVRLAHEFTPPPASSSRWCDSSSLFRKSAIPPVIASPGEHSKNTICLPNGSTNRTLDTAYPRRRSTGFEENPIELDPSLVCRGCLHPNNFKHPHTFLCAVHSTDERDKLSHRKDLRVLMREARDRLEFSRNSQVISGQRRLTQSHTAMDSQPTVIDLTEEFPSSVGNGDTNSDFLDEDQLQFRFVNDRHMHTTRRAPHLRLGATKGRSRPVNPVVISAVGPGCFPARRIPTRDGAYTILPAASFTGDLLAQPFTPNCSELTLDDETDQRVCIRHIPMSDGSYLNDHSTMTPGGITSGQLSGRFFGVPRRQSSSIALGLATNKRQQRRQHQQFPRTQFSSLNQWTHELGIPNRSSQLLGVNSPHPDPYSMSTEDDALSTSQPIPTCIGSGTLQLVDNRLSMVDSSFPTQLAANNSEPVILPNSTPQLAFDSQTPQMLSLVNQPVVVNRLARSMGPGTQGRVIVDDMREKSITGRSKKSTKATYRNNGPVFSPFGYTGILPPRYQHTVGHSSATYLTTSRKAPGVGLLAPRSAVLSLPYASCPTAELFSNPGSSGISFDNHEVAGIGRSTFIPHNISKSTRLSADSTQPRVSRAMSPFGSHCPMLVVDPTPDSESVDLDYCIQASSRSSAPKSDAVPIQSSTGAPTINRHSNPVPYSDQEPYPSTSHYSCPQGLTSNLSTVTSEHTPVLCRNRYFVIRPNAVKRPPSLVLKSKRPEAYSPEPTPPDPQSSSEAPP